MPEKFTDAEATVQGTIAHESPKPDEIKNPMGVPADEGLTIMENAADKVKRVPMLDRDLPINEGLDLTTPIDNAPVSQQMEFASTSGAVQDHTHGKTGQPVHQES